MTPRQAVASAAAPPLLAAAAGATLGVAAAVVASRWMPIGAASYCRAAPGHRRRLADPRPRLGPGAAPGGGRIGGRRGPGAHRPPAAGRRRAGPPWPRPRRPPGSACPVVVGARFALEPGRGRSAVPVRPGPARRGGRRPGRARRLHLLGRGVRRRRQPGALRPDLAARRRSSASPARTSGPPARSCGPWPPTRTSPASTTRGSAGRSPARSRWRASPTTRWRASGCRWCSPAGACPSAPDEIVLAPTTASDMHAATGSVVRLTGAAEPRAADRDRHRLRAGRPAQRLRRRRVAHPRRVRPALPRRALRLQVPRRRGRPAAGRRSSRRWRTG